MHDAAFFQKHDVEGYLGDLFDSMPGFLYFVKDTNFRLVAFNQRLAGAIEVEDKRSILGMTDHDYLPGHLADNYRIDDVQVLKTGEPVVNKVELVSRGRGFVDWSTTIKVPLVDSAGVIRGLVGVARPFETGISGIQIVGEMAPALDAMKKSDHRTLSIKELAALVHMSLSSFERKFKKYFSMSPKQYMRHLRVQQACHMLVQSAYSLSRVAGECGYADQSHFNREFLRVMKETPRQYRKRFRI